MSEEAENPNIEPTDADRRLIIGFVVCIVLGLGVLGWHYETQNTTNDLCKNPDAHCGESQL